jgi:hypothetical protein
LADNNATDFEREKWGVESAFRERELKVKEGELALKRAEEARSGWRSPLVVAILAAALAAAGNILAVVVNGYLQRDLEDKTSEDFRILEMIKTQNPDQNTANLKWLLKANLISDPKRRSDLQALVDKTPPGTGPATSGPTGADDVIKNVRALDEQIAKVSNSQNPTVKLWRDGLHPNKVSLEPNDHQLIGLLIERKSVLADAGPSLQNSAQLRDYICTHRWFVQAESKGTAQAEDYLRTQSAKDPRFELAENGGEGPLGVVPIFIGFFLTRHEAAALRREIGDAPIRDNQWDYKDYNLACPQASTPPN